MCGPLSENWVILLLILKTSLFSPSYEWFCFWVIVCKLQKYHIYIGSINKSSWRVLLDSVRIRRLVGRKVRRTKSIILSIKHFTSSGPRPEASVVHWSAAEMCLELKHQSKARCLSKTEAGQTKGSTVRVFLPFIYV